MRAMLAVLACLLCVCGPSLSRDAVAPGDRARIQGVITSQMEAFKRNDGAAALSFAAPNVKARFGDGPHFLSMVQELYPAVFRPRSVSFGALTVDGSSAEQKVELVGPDGQEALAVYDLVRGPDGGWRIAGCSLIKSERLET